MWRGAGAPDTLAMEFVMTWRGRPPTRRTDRAPKAQSTACQATFATFATLRAPKVAN